MPWIFWDLSRGFDPAQFASTPQTWTFSLLPSPPVIYEKLDSCYLCFRCRQSVVYLIHGTWIVVCDPSHRRTNVYVWSVCLLTHANCFHESRVIHAIYEIHGYGGNHVSRTIGPSLDCDLVGTFGDVRTHCLSECDPCPFCARFRWQTMAEVGQADECCLVHSCL